MSVLDDLKKLLVGASPGPWKVNWGTDLDLPDVLSLHLLDVDNSDFSTNFSTAQLAALIRPIAQALVESQEALGGIITGLEADDHYCCHHARLGRDDHTDDCYVGEARAALRMDGLEKAMEQEPPRS